MIILITGASHTGKTLLAQRMLAVRRHAYLEDFLRELYREGI